MKANFGTKSATPLRILRSDQSSDPELFFFTRIPFVRRDLQYLFPIPFLSCNSLIPAKFGSSAVKKWQVNIPPVQAIPIRYFRFLYSFVSSFETRELRKPIWIRNRRVSEKIRKLCGKAVLLHLQQFGCVIFRLIYSSGVRLRMQYKFIYPHNFMSLRSIKKCIFSLDK